MLEVILGRSIPRSPPLFCDLAGTQLLDYAVAQSMIACNMTMPSRMITYGDRERARILMHSDQLLYATGP